MKVLRKKLFYLSSRDRQSNEKIQNFSITFPENLMSVKQDELLRVSLVNFIVRNSFQPISINNNKFGVIMKFGDGTTRSATCTLPTGSYTLPNVAANITTVLNAVSTTQATFTVAWNGSITNTGTWTFVSGTTSVVSLQLLFNNKGLYGDSSAEILGFLSDTTIKSFPYTTPKFMYTGQEPYIQFHSDMPPVNIKPVSSTSNKLMNYTDILANIPIIVPPYSPIVFQAFSGDDYCFEFPARGQKLGTVNFWCTNRYNTPLVMIDDFDFVLKVEVLQDDSGEMRKMQHKQFELQKIQALHAYDNNNN